MSNSMERYKKLGFKEAISRIHHYPIACKDLSLILREAYNKLPKNLQSIVFQDTLSAFRLLPQMQTRGAVSAAHLLYQSAEAALPKQKKNLAVKEFKHAKVAHKRRWKAHHEEESKHDFLPKNIEFLICHLHKSMSGTIDLPQDVLLHIFSFLDIKSLVSVGLVCWSWNFAASDNQLWESQYAIIFSNKHGSSKIRGLRNSRKALLQENTVSKTSTDWREAFKSAYVGNSLKRLTSNGGYCVQCETIVWLDNMKCCNGDHGLQSGNQQIVPVSPHQVVEYLLNGSSSIISSSESDSDSESDERLIPRLWAYPRHIGRCQNK